MNCWQLASWKNAAQAANCCGVEREVGTCGKPMLQVGGVHEAVTAAAPGDGVERLHDCVQPLPGFTTAAWEDVQVRGVLFSTTSSVLLRRELWPWTSVTVAIAVSASPLAPEKLVRVDPAE